MIQTHGPRPYPTYSKQCISIRTMPCCGTATVLSNVLFNHLRELSLHLSSGQPGKANEVSPKASTSSALSLHETLRTYIGIGLTAAIQCRISWAQAMIPACFKHAWNVPPRGMLSLCRKLLWPTYAWVSQASLSLSSLQHSFVWGPHGSPHTNVRPLDCWIGIGSI